MRVLFKIYTGVVNFFWLLLLILLPITSTPAVRDLLQISVIAGPAVLALAILLVIWFVPYLLQGGGMPEEMLPLIGFGLAAILSISVSQFLVIPTFKDQSMLRTALSAFITLLVGIGYLALTYSRISNEAEFRQTLKWIYLGGSLMLIWSVTQSSVWFINGRYFQWMRDFQDIVSLGPLYRQRASGFALEPSWLAHMLNMLYLPMWLAASTSGYSVFKFRLFKKITGEMVLLALGILVLILTLSRVGWITFFCMAAFLVVKWNIRLIRWAQNRFRVFEHRRGFSTVIISTGLVLVYSLLIILAAYGMSRVDPRMADLFSPEFLQLKNMNRYANALQFGERVVYWQAGWEVFNRHPMLGVGLGNAGRWFSQTIPSYGMNLIEVRQLLFRSGDIPNIKNLWIRLLAETGIVGFAFYTAWLFSLFKRSISFSFSRTAITTLAMYWGIFIVIGIILEGFSIDSFAMPFFWISAGIILSVTKISDNITGAVTVALSEEE